MTKVQSVHAWIYRYRSSITFILAICLIASLQWRNLRLSNVVEPSNPYHTEITDKPLDSGFSDLNTAAYAPVPTVQTRLDLPSHLADRLDAGEYDAVRGNLLGDSMQAVVDGNQPHLAKSLAQVGLVALEEWETDTALVYLNEALAVYEELNDPTGIANVNLHIGRAHIIERRRARRAALAHDTTLLAHWYIANDRFDEAYPMLRKSVEENLALSRHGAAAQGYETMYRGFRERGELTNAIEAAKEAAMLHASAGKVDVAAGILDNLIDDGASYSEVDSTRTTLNKLADQYVESVQQMGRARDYQQLYNHYISEGDPVSAWRFRLEAESVLSQASKRARYRRQSGVLVLLYDSNNSMEKARTALENAATHFQSVNQQINMDGQSTELTAESLYRQATQLMSEIY